MANFKIPFLDEWADFGDLSILTGWNIFNDISDFKHIVFEFEGKYYEMDTLTRECVEVSKQEVEKWLSDNIMPIN